MNCFEPVKKFMFMEDENYRKQYKKEIDDEIRIEEYKVNAHF